MVRGLLGSDSMVASGCHGVLSGGVSVDVTGHVIAMLDIDGHGAFIAAPERRVVLESGMGGHSLIASCVGGQLGEFLDEGIREVMRLK